MLSDIDLTGDAVAITKVDATHIAMVVAATGAMCNVRFSVDGNTATADSGQTCAISDAGYIGHAERDPLDVVAGQQHDHDVDERHGRRLDHHLRADLDRHHGAQRGRRGAGRLRLRTQPASR